MEYPQENTQRKTLPTKTEDKGRSTESIQKEMTFLHKVQYVFHTQVMKIALQEVCWHGSKALASKCEKEVLVLRAQILEKPAMSLWVWSLF